MSKRISVLPRWVHHLYANLFGYFWVPCPICEKYFGGHEKHGDLCISKHGGELTCWACRKEANKRNKKNGFIVIVGR